MTRGAYDQVTVWHATMGGMSSGTALLLWGEIMTFVGHAPIDVVLIDFVRNEGSSPKPADLVAAEAMRRRVQASFWRRPPVIMPVITLWNRPKTNDWTSLNTSAGRVAQRAFEMAAHYGDPVLNVHMVRCSQWSVVTQFVSVR